MDAAAGRQDMVAVLFAVIVVEEIEVQLRSDGTLSVRTTGPLNP